MYIYVSKADIAAAQVVKDRGSFGNWNLHCPIAQALKRRGFRAFEVFATSVQINGREYLLPPVAAKMSEDSCYGCEHMKPIRFRITGL